MCLKFFGAALAGTTLCLSSGGDNTRAATTLTTAAQVEALTTEEARKGTAVLLKGVITQVVPEWWGFSLQDAGAGVYVAGGTPETANLRPGQVVEVEGRAGPGNFALMVVASRVRVIGESRLPSGRPVTWQRLSTGDCDNDYVEVEGVVRSAGVVEPPVWEWRALAMRLDVGGNLIWAYLREPGALQQQRLVDGTVRVRGVCMVLFNDRRQFLESSLSVPNSGEVHVVEPGPQDPFNLPLQSMNQAFVFRPGAITFHRVKVQGVVTLTTAGRLYVQQGDDAMLVRTASEPAVRPGDRVEVVGFPTAGASSTALDDALIRVTGHEREPAPRDATGAVLTTRKPGEMPVTLDALLVRVHGELLDRVHSGHDETLLLQDGPIVFNVRMPERGEKKWPTPAPGSRLAVTGVCSVKPDERGLPAKFDLLMRSPADLQVLAEPSWLTRDLALRLGAGLVALMIGTLLWLALLRRRVREQTGTLRLQFEREAALEQRYRDLVENASDMVYARDLEGRLLQVNRGAEDLTGYTRQELLAMNIVDLLVPDEREHARKEFSYHGGDGRRPVLREWRFLTKDGRELTVEIRKRILMEDGRPVRAECIGRDVTARKQAQAEAESAREALRQAHDQLERRVRERTAELLQATGSLRESERRFRLAAENFPSLFVIYDAERRIQFINGQGARMTGWDTQAAIGRRDEELLPASVTDCYLPALRRSVEQRSIQSTEGDVKLPSGTFHLTFTYVPVLSEAGELTQILGITHDMTERKRLQEQLHHSQKLEAVGLLAGGVAHDFNNMLAVIMGHAQLLFDDLAPGAQRDAVQEILKAAERNAELTRQLLTFSRRQPLEARAVDLNASIAGLQRILRRLIREDILVETALAPDLGTVLMDPGQLDQILVNLVINARDAMPLGGCIRIATRNVRLDSGFAAMHPPARTGDHVLLEVNDTGSGMDEETLHRIFEPFFTTKTLGKGSGLGLAMVYGIVTQSNGFIDVHSEPGKGATFRIYLPRVAACPAVIRPRKEERPARGYESVLIVEDDAALRELMRDALRTHGYTVREAADGREALEIFERETGRFQLLITDLVMPNMGGHELAARVNERYGSRKILFISGYSEQPGEAAGAYLQKPFKVQALMRKVRDVLDGPAKTTNTGANP